MIQMPRRSVTRFFIPLIDVLILLFCIFLLMPLVKAQPGSSEEKGAGSPTGGGEPAPRDQPGHETADRLRAELEQLRREKMQVLQQRLVVRVLEIDARTGKLFYHDPERAEVSNEADARQLVLRDRKAVGEGTRELYYEILYPRDPDSPYPLREKRKTYDEWFQDVPHGWDIPGSLRKGETP